MQVLCGALRVRAVHSHKQGRDATAEHACSQIGHGMDASLLSGATRSTPYKLVRTLEDITHSSNDVI